MSSNKIDTLNITDLIINIWWCGDHIKNCGNCRVETYSELCVESLKKRWQPEWGNANLVVNKILSNDKKFIDDFNCINTVRESILDFLQEFDGVKKNYTAYVF